MSTWTNNINITKPDISGTFFSDNLVYGKFTSKTINSDGYTTSTTTQPCIEQTDRGGPFWQPDDSKCPDAAVTCPADSSPLYSEKQGVLFFHTRPSFYCTSCYEGPLGYNLCAAASFACSKCVCSKQTLVACGQQDFNNTMGLDLFDVNIVVKNATTPVKVLGVSLVDNSWKYTGTSMQTARQGNIGVHFSSNFTDNFLLTVQGAKDIVNWIEQFKTKSPPSSTPDPIVPSLIYDYFKISVITTTIFTDFVNQLYNLYTDKNNRPAQVKPVYDPTNLLWWDNIEEYTSCYVHFMLQALYPQDPDLECIFNKGKLTYGEYTDGHAVTGFSQNPVIHVPIPMKDSENKYTLTFTLPYSDYDKNKSPGDLGAYCSSLMDKILRDDLVLYNGEINKRTGPILIESPKYKAIYITTKVGKGATKGDEIFPIVSFKNMTNTSSKSNVLNYILGVRITLIVKKWSPMLLLYFLNTGPGQLFTEDVCNQIPSDTDNIIPAICFQYLPENQKFINLTKYCQTDMTFGDRTPGFDTPEISKQLLIASSSNCGCTNGRIAPFNERNTDIGIKTNLCFNSTCKNSGFRKEFIKSILGDETKCKNYCSNIYKWLSSGQFMQHSNEIDTDLYQKLCGDYKPTNPRFNKNVAITSIIITILTAIFALIIMRLHNFNITFSILVMFIILISFGALSIWLSSELSGQNFITEKNVDGRYKKQCLSKTLKINLPSQFCPDDLGDECAFNEDCKSTNCNAACIAQFCTPGAGQERKMNTIKRKYFSVIWFVLALALFLLLPQIIIQGLKLTKVRELQLISIIVIYIIFFVLCFTPILILYFHGKQITVYADKCTPKVSHTSLKSSQQCSLKPCIN